MLNLLNTQLLFPWGEKVGGCTAHAKYCGAGTGKNVKNKVLQL